MDPPSEPENVFVSQRMSLLRDPSWTLIHKELHGAIDNMQQ
jgi:hypothetical protein